MLSNDRKNHQQVGKEQNAANQNDKSHTGPGDKYMEPPIQPTVILQRDRDEPFMIGKSDIGKQKVITFLIKFTLKNRKNGNNVFLFFKRFLTVLFVANNNILLEKWSLSEENPISKAIDIAYSGGTIPE